MYKKKQLSVAKQSEKPQYMPKIYTHMSWVVIVWTFEEGIVTSSNMHNIDLFIITH